GSRSCLLDCAAPRASLYALGLDERLKALQVVPHTCGHDPQHVPDVFDQTFRLVIDLQHDARVIITKAVEGHDPGVARASGIGPRNALVRNLFSNDRAPFFRLAANLYLPVEMRVIQLCDLLHTFHEAWEFLE